MTTAVLPSSSSSGVAPALPTGNAASTSVKPGGGGGGGAGGGGGGGKAVRERPPFSTSFKPTDPIVNDR